MSLNYQDWLIENKDVGQRGFKMNIKSFLGSIFNQKNLDNTIKSLDEGVASFNKGMQDFGDSMDKVTKELSKDVEKSNSNAKSRAIKDKENLDKIWGKKK